MNVTQHLFQVKSIYSTKTKRSHKNADDKDDRQMQTPTHRSIEKTESL